MTEIKKPSRIPLVPLSSSATNPQQGKQNEKFLLEFLKYCHIFESLSPLKEKERFTLGEQALLEDILSKISSLLHRYGFFPEYDKEAAYSAEKVRSVIIANLSSVQPKEIQTVCIEQMLKLEVLMQGRVSVQVLLNRVIVAAQNLQQTIKNCTEKPDVPVSVAQAEAKNRVAFDNLRESYGYLLSQCRFNGFLSNDQFIHLNVLHAKKREKIFFEIVEKIIFKQTAPRAPEKFTQQLEAVLQHITKAFDCFAQFKENSITSPHLHSTGKPPDLKKPLSQPPHLPQQNPEKSPSLLLEEVIREQKKAIKAQRDYALLAKSNIYNKSVSYTLVQKSWEDFLKVCQWAGICTTSDPSGAPLAPEVIKNNIKLAIANLKKQPGLIKNLTLIERSLDELFSEHQRISDTHKEKKETSFQAGFISKIGSKPAPKNPLLPTVTPSADDLEETTQRREGP